jgi:hypothetical protein
MNITQALLSSLAEERSKQHERLLAGLAKKKATYLRDIADVDRGSPQAMSDVQNMEDKARKELIQLDLSFDEQVLGPSNCFIINLGH